MLGIAALVLLGKAVLGRSPDTPSPQPSGVYSAEPFLPPSSVPTQVPTAPPEPSVVEKQTPESDVKRFSLVILPEFASVEIDGKPATVKNGNVEVAGPLGRVFLVKVFKNAYSVEQKVTITEQGVLPNKVNLYAPKVSSPEGAGPSAPPQKKPGGTQTNY